MAAETADDNSKPDDDWLLLCDVRTLVMQYCKEARAAERLILNFARRGHFKSYGRFLDDGPGIPPTNWGTAHPKIGVYVFVDFASSTVTYTRDEPDSYAFTLLFDETLEGFLPSPYYQIQLVRLLRSDVLSMLRAVELLPVQTDPSAAPAPTVSVNHDVRTETSHEAPEEMKEWFPRAFRENPKQTGERVRDHIDRLYELSLHANIRKPWSKATMSRRYYDKK